MATLERYYAERERMECLAESMKINHAKKSVDQSEAQSDNKMLKEDFYPSIDAGKKDDDDIVQVFDTVSNKTLAKDATVGDLFLLHKRTHWYPPKPTIEEMYAAAIGAKQGGLIKLEKCYAAMMRNLLYYTAYESIKSSPSYKFLPIEAKIGKTTYTCPTGDQELQPIEIGLNKTLHVPTNFHFMAKSKDSSKSIIFMLMTDYNCIKMKIWGKSKLAVAEFIEWFDAQVKKHNFLKGAKIDGNGHFLSIDPNMDWSDIILPAELREKFEREILDMFRMQHIYAANGVPPKAGFALLGPPGTGKTTLIKVLAVKLDKVTVIMVTPDSVRHGTSDVQGIYTLAQELAPSLVMWEDADIYLGDRHSMLSHGSILSEVMNILDGIVPLRGVVTGISTNRPQDLEAALIDRPGRIDVKVYLGPPDELGRFELLRQHLSKVKVDPKDVKETARDERIASFTGCYIADVAKRAIKRAIADGRYDKSTLVASVSLDDMSRAIDDILKERQISGDFTNQIKVGVKVESDETEKLISCIESFGRLDEATSAKRIKKFLRSYYGEDLDFDEPMSKDQKSKMSDLLDEPQLLRRIGVKSSAIKLALDIVEDEDRTLDDIAMVLSGR